jgi:uncharacterized protein
VKPTSFSGFDWDEGNTAKCTKHGLTIAEIEAVFLHPHHLAPDLAHSAVETRFLAIGKGAGDRPMLIAFTMRGTQWAPLVRPISARYMHQKEVRHYEQAIAQTRN